MITSPIGRRSFLAGRFRRAIVGTTEVVEVGGAPPIELGLPPRFEDERAAFRKRMLTRLPRIAGRAVIERFACLASTGTACTVCAEHCPIPGAVSFDGLVPRIDASRCDGCGACERACPAPTGAIRVLPLLPLGGRR